MSIALQNQRIGALRSPFAGCRVSMFENAFGKVPRDADLASILEAVRKGRWREQVEALRPLLAAVETACRKRFGDTAQGVFCPFGKPRRVNWATGRHRAE